MKTIRKPALAVFAVLVVSALFVGCGRRDESAEREPGETTVKVQGKYASVNGLKMYYEIHGTGRPLILLHGALASIDMFGKVLPSFAKTRQVIAIDQQAMGARPTSTAH